MAHTLIKVAFLVFLLAASPTVTDAWFRELVGAAVGGTMVIVGAPVVLGAAGFTGAGIAAGSVGAKLMSVAWTSGYGMTAVATLQSAGAAGVGAATVATGTLAGAGAAHATTHMHDD